MRSFQSIRKFFGNRKPNRRPQSRRWPLQLEALEDRLVPTVVFQPTFGSEALDASSQDHALQSPTVYLLFWGSYWQTTQGQSDETALNEKIKILLGSPYLTGLIQYGGDGKAFLGSSTPFTDSITSIPTVPEGPSMTPTEAVLPSDINTFIANTINHSGGVVPEPTDLFIPQSDRFNNTMYVVITEPGVPFIDTDRNGNPVLNPDGTDKLAPVGRSFNQLGSYTDPVTGFSGNFHYIYLSLGGSTSTGADLVGGTATFSHELAEGSSYADDGTGVVVDPSPFAPADIASTGNQICDMEPEAYRGNLDGLIVAPYFSKDGNFIVPDGNSQQVLLNAAVNAWTVSGGKSSFNGHYDLTINGDQLGANTNDTLTLSVIGLGASIGLNGEGFFLDQQAVTIDVINVNLGGGNDQVNINDLNGQNLTINQGPGNDTVNVGGTFDNLDTVQGTVNINGGSNDTLIVNDQNGPQGGIWELGGSSISRVGAAQINYTPLDTNVVLDGSTAGGNLFVLSEVAENLDELPGTTVSILPAQTSLTVDGGGIGSSLVLNDQNNPNASSWSVTGNSVTRSYVQTVGPLHEVVSFSVTYSNVANLTLNGGKGNTTFTLSPTTQDLNELPGTITSPLGLASSLTVNGGAASNTLILDDQNNDNNSSWSVAGTSLTRSYGRTIFHHTEIISFTVNYSNVDTLALHAGNGNDTFTLSPITQDLDELPITRFGSSAPHTSLTVVGGTGSNSLVVDDQNNPDSSTWTVTNTSVTRSHNRQLGSTVQLVTDVIHYSNIFDLTLNGGSGGNSFLISSTPAKGQVNVDGGTGSNGLTTNNGRHTFTINGQNAGTYANVVFQNIASLTGGTGLDIFKFVPGGQLDGTIDGGGAPAGQGDWLDYSALTTPVTVKLANGTATGTATGAAGGIKNIQNVIGSAGNDTLTGSALGNILIGGAGTNVISGGSGRSLLIGGTGSSTIVGGANDDILIAGTTTFDANEIALMSILQEWQRTDKNYAQRIAELRSGGGFNGQNKLILGTTVLDNDGVSKLTGGPGLDWFFADLGGGVTDTITDLNNGGTEQVN
jgi:hypothetical protein